MVANQIEVELKLKTWRVHNKLPEDEFKEATLPVSSDEDKIIVISDVERQKWLQGSHINTSFILGIDGFDDYEQFFYQALFAAKREGESGDTPMELISMVNLLKTSETFPKVVSEVFDIEKEDEDTIIDRITKS